MHKFASALLLVGGAVLLVTWFVSPAASVPRQATPYLAPNPLDRMAPELAEVNAQIDRLSVRLSSPSDYPSPTRDPFNFGRLPQVQTSRSTPTAPATPVVPPPLPRLIAIIADHTDTGDVRRAALSVGDDIQIVKAGDTTGALVVGTIADDGVELLDQSGAAFHVLLSTR